MVKIGLIQDCPGNALEKIEYYAREAASLGCEALCFPECFLTGYEPERARELSLERTEPILEQVAALAQEHGVDLLVGFMERSEEAFFITHGLFRRDGEKMYYRKTHLGAKEARFFAAGDALEVFSLTGGLRIGFQLCVENHYPEITQTLALKGAEAVFAPHASPRVSGDRERIWSKYIPARSYDNRVYMLCCNLWDENRFSGGCLATDPNGDVAASYFDDGKKLLVVQLDRDLVARRRLNGDKPSAHFFPQRRRPELYKLP